MASNMNLRLNDRRERRFENLQDATGENTTSGALDVAAEFYIKQAGGNPAIPTGQIAELMQLADEQGSVTAAEIAAALDCEELRVRYENQWSVGDESAEK